MSRSWMTAIEKHRSMSEPFSAANFFVEGMRSERFFGAFVLGTANAQETQATQPGMVPNGDTAQGNVGADDAVANTAQGEHPLEPALALAAVEALRAFVPTSKTTPARS